MRIFIDNTNRNYSKKFYRWMLFVVKVEVLKQFKYQAAKKFVSQLEQKVLSPQDVWNILYTAMNSLRLVYTKRAVVIDIDPYAKYKGYNLSKLCNFISYGSLLIRGYPLIPITFDNIATNIDYYFNRYKGGVL